MARILRGEVRWPALIPVGGNEQAGLRPVLIVSHDVFNERSGTEGTGKEWFDFGTLLIKDTNDYAQKCGFTKESLLQK